MGLDTRLEYYSTTVVDPISPYMATVDEISKRTGTTTVVEYTGTLDFGTAA